MTQQELVAHIVGGSAYLRSCGNDAVAHSVYLALFEMARAAAEGPITVQLSEFLQIEVSIK